MVLRFTEAGAHVGRGGHEGAHDSLAEGAPRGSDSPGTGSHGESRVVLQRGWLLHPVAPAVSVTYCPYGGKFGSKKVERSFEPN